VKAEKYILVAPSVKQAVVQRINSLALDGRVTCILKPTAAKSGRQRGLQHMWYRDVEVSGLGGKHEESTLAIDLHAKYRWALPQLIVGDDNFAELYLEYFRVHGKNTQKMTWFVKNHVHTEDLSQNQMAHFLTCFRDYYAQIGVNLTDPDEFGWNKLLEQVQ